ncbi:transcription elongation factor [Vibrio galatheae]|uniref:Transcription elongation factor n=1 Tax=Vibrio galatheae TaxID=579748 RepID=A0A0F4NHD1_9VIBR|nr:GreA/GreB family elongation factor [Vibrio galatheae]KJY82359.1 transcription elongation factor [Vibrio galatheae]
MNKLDLRQAIVSFLRSKLAVAVSSAQRAIESATDEETVPEHKYDTLALEASYLAHGQAMRVQECEQEIQRITTMLLPDAPDKVMLGSLVSLLDVDDKRQCFFLAPCAGGLKVPLQHHSIMLVTFDSPLGKALKAKRVGDEVSYKIGKIDYNYEIETIS